MLCYLQTEDKMAWSEIPLDFFDFILEAINEALLAKDRRVYGFCISELLNGLAALQFCFPDKLYFINKHPLSLISNLLTSPDQTDILAAVNLVWQMSFCEQNREVIKVSFILRLKIPAQFYNHCLKELDVHQKYVRLKRKYLKTL